MDSTPSILLATHSLPQKSLGDTPCRPGSRGKKALASRAPGPREASVSSFSHTSLPHRPCLEGFPARRDMKRLTGCSPHQEGSAPRDSYLSAQILAPAGSRRCQGCIQGPRLWILDTGRPNPLSQRFGAWVSFCLTKEGLEDWFLPPHATQLASLKCETQLPPSPTGE